MESSIRFAAITRVFPTAKHPRRSPRKETPIENHGHPRTKVRVSRPRLLQTELMQVTPYTWLMIAGIALSVWYWSRHAPRRPGMAWIYFSALLGAFLGGKIVYIAAEGWLHWNDPDRWMHLAT